MSKNKKITTVTGKQIDPFNFTAYEIDLEDLLVAGCQKVRFGGQLSLDLPHSYNIVQHSIIVSDYLCDNNAEGFALAGLAHDLVEGISPVSDVPSPSKTSVAVLAFDELMTVREYEKRATAIIFD